MVTLAGDSRVHVAVSAFSATVTLGTTTTVGAQRSALNVQLLLTVIFSFRHSFSRWSRSRPFVALYFTGRSTFLLHLMSPFLIVPVLSASDVIAFAVDLFVKPGFRHVNMYCTCPITHRICSLRTLATGDIRWFGAPCHGELGDKRR